MGRREAGAAGPDRGGNAGGEETGPVALSRLLDEIRADRRWREEVAARRSEGAEGGPHPEDTGAPYGRLAAPAADPALAAALDGLDAAVAAADRVVPIEAGRPIVGEAWARLRRQVHGEIRIYQDRQTVVNRQLAAALRRLAGQLDPAAPEAAMSSLWSALGRVEARVAALERAVGVRAEGETPLGRLSAALDAVIAEIEPLGALRVAVEQLEARLAEVERWRASG